MRGLADHHDSATVGICLFHNFVNTQYLGTSRVDHLSCAGTQRCVHRHRNTVGTNNHSRTFGNFLGGLNYLQTLAAELLHNVIVVNQVAQTVALAPLAEHFLRQLHRAVNPKAEACRFR